MKNTHINKITILLISTVIGIIILAVVGEMRCESGGIDIHNTTTGNPYSSQQLSFLIIRCSNQSADFCFVYFLC